VNEYEVKISSRNFSPSVMIAVKSFQYHMENSLGNYFTKSTGFWLFCKQLIGQQLTGQKQSVTVS